MFNPDGECGTGAVVPWADRLWVVTYAPHKPNGSADKLYEITPDLTQIVRPESVGGTPANRLIHRESGQLFIGPYVIDGQRQVRTIPPGQMPGRLTGNARHLTDPAHWIYYATMEEGFYEVNVSSARGDRELYPDANRDQAGRTHAGSLLPGYHGKGLYSSQGRLVYANNGEYSPGRDVPTETPSGCLAEWDGRHRRGHVVRRNQFTEVTGPGGLDRQSPLATTRSGAIGWDHRSLILMLLDTGHGTPSGCPNPAQLRRRARLEHRVAAHPRHRRNDAADDHARRCSGGFRVGFAPAHRWNPPRIELPQGHRRFRALG
jgi:hypothetical protein